MRKLFRFKYEPCNKTCYCYCSKLMGELRAIGESERQSLVNKMVEAHNRLCDNPNYSFGVDVDEENNVFVGHLRTPKNTDLFASKDFSKCIEMTCRNVLATEIPKVNAECKFGDNGAEDLGREILKFCEDVAYEKIKETHCECKS